MRAVAWLVLAAVGCGGPATPAPQPEPVVSNEQPEIIDQQPSLAVVLVVDRSGSMQGGKLDAARAGAHAVAEGLPSDAMFAMIAFDSEATTIVRLQPARNRDRIATEIDTLTAGGGTNYYPGLREAAELLSAVSVERKVVIFLSDGEAAYDGVVELITDMHDHGVTTSTIGLGDADRTLLGMMADAGGGGLYMVNDPSELARVMQAAMEP